MNFFHYFLAASGLGAVGLVAYLEWVRRTYVFLRDDDWEINVPSAEANRPRRVTPPMLREPTCCCGQMIEPGRLSAYWRIPSAN